MDLLFDIIILGALIALGVFLKTTHRQYQQKRETLTKVCLDTKSGASKTIITIGVAAKSEWGFSGYSLKFAFQKLNLLFSQTCVFERLDMHQNVCYSVVSMSEPGTFLANDVSLCPIPGVFLLMLLPMEADSLLAFDDMIATAKQLNYVLDGVLCDANMKALLEADILALREQVKLFQSKKRARA